MNHQPPTQYGRCNMIRKKIQFIFLIITTFIIFSSYAIAQTPEKGSDEKQNQEIKTLKENGEKADVRLDSLELKSAIQDVINQHTIEKLKSQKEELNDKIEYIDAKRKEINELIDQRVSDFFRNLSIFIGFCTIIFVVLSLLGYKELKDILNKKIEDYFEKKAEKSIDHLIEEKSQAIDKRFLQIDKMVLEKGNEIDKRIHKLDQLVEDKSKELGSEIDEVKQTAKLSKATVLILQGNEFANKHQYNEAIDCYNEALEINPSSIYAYLFRGFTYANISEYANAKKDYLKVFEFEPDNILALTSITEIKIVLNEYEDEDFQKYFDLLKLISSQLEDQLLYLYFAAIVSKLRNKSSEQSKLEFLNILPTALIPNWSTTVIETWLNNPKTDITSDQCHYIQSLTDKLKAKMKK